MRPGEMYPFRSHHTQAEIMAEEERMAGYAARRAETRDRWRLRCERRQQALVAAGADRLGDALSRSASGGRS